jgi:hypothetical protein
VILYFRLAETCGGNPEDYCGVFEWCSWSLESNRLWVVCWEGLRSAVFIAVGLFMGLSVQSRDMLYTN